MANISKTRRTSEGVEYLGETYPGFNKPKKAPPGSKHKFVVLAKKGDEVKVVRFGHRDYEDFRQHRDPERRENYCSRSSGIKGTSDKFSANFWSRTKLWSC